MTTKLDRKPVGWPQLCAIAKGQIEAEPSIENSEWSERIKTRLLRLGFTYPEEPSAINRAMAAVERAMSKRWGPRQAPPPLHVPSPEPQSPPPLTPAEAQAAFQRFALHTMLKAMPSEDQPSATEAQIRAWRASQQTGAWVKTRSGWERAPAKPSCAPPSPDSGVADESVALGGDRRPV